MFRKSKCDLRVLEQSAKEKRLLIQAMMAFRNKLIATKCTRFFFDQYL